MSYTYDIQTTDGPYNPDEWASVGVGSDGMTGASSTVWCRVTCGDQSTAWTECLKVDRGDWSTGWAECKGVTSLHRARGMLDWAFGLPAHPGFFGDPDGPIIAAFCRVTGSRWPG